MTRKNLSRLLFEEEEKEEKFDNKWKKWVDDSQKLSDVDMDAARKARQLDNPDSNDGVDVATSQSAHDAKTLKPTQSSMNLTKAAHFALGMLNGSMYGSGGPGGDTGAFICNNYLLDGHHRWIATCMVAPGASINGYKMTGMSPQEAVKVLNAATGALMDHNVGKPGEGSFAVFADVDKVYKALKSHDTFVEGKNGVPKSNENGMATKVCEAWSAGKINHKGMEIKKAKDGPKEGDEALKWAAQAMVDNCGKCAGVKDSAVLLAQGRPEMPVADDTKWAGGKGEGAPSGANPVVDSTEKVINALNKGGIDLKEAHDLLRWQRLSGLLKD